MHSEEEAVILCRYLTGTNPVKKVIERYSETVRQEAVSLTPAQQKKWLRCLRHPFLLPYADAAWAWPDPLHPLRHRIYIMLAILEAHRNYQPYFLPAERSYSYRFFIVLRLVRSAFRLAAGKILLWLL